MKKISILLAGLLFIGLPCISAFTSVNPGMWTLDTGINNDYCGEIFETPNHPGAGGNALVFIDSGQWALWAQCQSASFTSESGYTYETPYTGEIYLASDEAMWDDGLSFVNFIRINYNNGEYWGSDLEFKFTVYVIDNSLRYDLVAMFNAASEDVNYFKLYTIILYIIG